MTENYFVTAIGTDSGKTLVSAILVEALQGDYWKPIQAGYPRDTETVQSLVTNRKSYFHSEAYLVNTPASPHASAKIDGVNIRKESICLPKTDNSLVIEGAGGVLVPINDKDTIIDLISQLHSQVILVSNLYLGSINHTLLTVEALKARNLEVRGIIFNGPENQESERIILEKSGYKLLFTLRPLEKVDRKTVQEIATRIKSQI